MRFVTDGLLSKWGFQDGDILDDVFYDLDVECGFELSHKLLIKIVRERILPLLDQRVEVYEISTIHNPIRVNRIDGVEYADCLGLKKDPRHLTPEIIDIPDSEIIEMAKEFLGKA